MNYDESSLEQSWRMKLAGGGGEEKKRGLRIIDFIYLMNFLIGVCR